MPDSSRTSPSRLGPPARRRGRIGWLLGAAALLLLAAVLMSTPRDEVPRTPEAPAVRIPMGRDPAESDRAKARLRPLPPPPAPPGAPEEPVPEARDPRLSALSAPARRTVVFEANAVRHSAFGELLLRCLGEAEDSSLEEMKRELGLDPTEDIDRIAVQDDVLLVSGFFEGVDFDRLLEDRGRAPYGDAAVIYAPRPGGGSEGSEAIGIWDDSLVVVGPSEEAVRAAIDRIEGRAPLEPGALDVFDAYGEVYGRLGPTLLARIAAGFDPSLEARINEIVEAMELHVDAQRDIGMRLSVRGRRPEEMEQLARALGGALAAARLAAQESGDEDLARLLDYAEIDPAGAYFDLRLAVPFEFIEEKLGDCRWVRRRSATPSEEGHDAPADAAPADPEEGAGDG